MKQAPGEYEKTASETLPSPERDSAGHLMYDPELPGQELEPIVEAFASAGRWFTACPVEGFVRPHLQIETGRVFIGLDAILGYVASLDVAED